MKLYILIICLLLTGKALEAQTLSDDDLRRIEQRRVFASGFYRNERGSASYCAGANELAFICAAENKKDSAFYFLNETFSYKGSDVKVLNSIYDPFNLGSYPFIKWTKSPEWKSYEKTISDKYLASRKDLKLARLSLELIRALGTDQSIRLYSMKIRHDDKAKADWHKIDSAGLLLIKQAVKKYGFPGRSMVGDDGYEAAFILCQHADDDLAFQKTILDQLKKLTVSGDAKKQDQAYLTDRIMVKEKGMQVYGTQFKSAGLLYPIQDSANVDRHRAEMGLGTLAEYKKGFSGSGTGPGRN